MEKLKTRLTAVGVLIALVVLTLVSPVICLGQASRPAWRRFKEAVGEARDALVSAFAEAYTVLKTGEKS